MPSLRNVADDTIRVLFIEDDPAVAEMYKLKLELDGYLVSIVTLRDDVVDAAARVRPELIFLDTQRREEAGMTTLRTLRESNDTRGVPVIILSSHHPQELADSGFKADVMDYVVQGDHTLSSLSRDLDQWSIAPKAGLTA
jgi:DNA-binding response OmpR family regulator